MSEQGRFDRITFGPQIMGGRACIRGMRITVSVIVGQLAAGASVPDILAEYSDLEEEDVRQLWLTRPSSRARRSCWPKY